jgi:hypothetical protein
MAYGLELSSPECLEVARLLPQRGRCCCSDASPSATMCVCSLVRAHAHAHHSLEEE